jgi:predicted P-loop ATPase
MTGNAGGNGDPGPRRRAKAEAPRRKGRSRMLFPAKGRPLANHANVITLFEAEPTFQGLFRYNLLALVIDVLKPIPRPAGKPAIPDGPYPRILTETDVSRLLEYVQHAGINIASRDTIIHAVEDLARRNCYHPFREYLEGLTWDRTPRIDDLLFTYFGVKRDPARDQYHRLVGRFFLMGLAKRAFAPGCQNDYVPVLEGKQGRLKTKALEILGGAYFGGDPPDIHTKDFKQYLAGKMLVELGELDALRKAEISFTKRFITTKTDDYRPPYGRLNRKVPRSACFVGTTNEDDWSSDYTGARRFWPVIPGIIDIDALRRDRDELFAEAVARIRKDERYWPTYEEEQLMFEPEQEARYAESDWMPTIAQWIADGPKAVSPEVRRMGGAKDWAAANPPGFTGLDVAQGCLGIEHAKDFRRAEQLEVRKCLKRLGCRQPPRQKARRYWLPPEGGSAKPNGAKLAAAKPSTSKPNGEAEAGDDLYAPPF